MREREIRARNLRDVWRLLRHGEAQPGDQKAVATLLLDAANFLDQEQAAIDRFFSQERDQ